MKTVIRLAILAAGLASSLMFGAAAAYASGDEPWCAVMQIGEGAQAWDCHYQTVEECVPNVLTGNRGSCIPNPYGPSPAAASVPSQGHANTPSSTPANRKFQGHAK